MRDCYRNMYRPDAETLLITECTLTREVAVARTHTPTHECLFADMGHTQTVSSFCSGGSNIFRRYASQCLAAVPCSLDRDEALTPTDDRRKAQRTVCTLNAGRCPDNNRCRFCGCWSWQFIVPSVAATRCPLIEAHDTRALGKCDRLIASRILTNILPRTSFGSSHRHRESHVRMTRRREGKWGSDGTRLVSL